MQDREQESITDLDFEDPSTSEPSRSTTQEQMKSSIQKKYERNEPKRCENLMNSKSKWHETRTDPNNSATRCRFCARNSWRESSVYDVRGGNNDHGFQGNAVVSCLYWDVMLEALDLHWGDDFIFDIPDDRTDDLEQLIREMFKMRTHRSWFSEICGILEQEGGVEHWRFLLDARSETLTDNDWRVWFQR